MAMDATANWVQIFIENIFFKQVIMQLRF